MIYGIYLMTGRCFVYKVAEKGDMIQGNVIVLFGHSWLSHMIYLS